MSRISPRVISDLDETDNDISREILSGKKNSIDDKKNSPTKVESDYLTV